MISPYAELPARQFWRTGVREADWSLAEGLYQKKFPITNAMRIMTAGSCFAQHVAAHLTDHGYSVIDGEPGPSNLVGFAAKNFGYQTYSARYGNIYTARQLVQLMREAYGRFEPEDIVWEKGGRYYDALRPAVEPYGLDSPEEVRAHRIDHLSRLRAVLNQVDLLVFTFGLTEGWIHKSSGTVYPTAPGTIAGSFDPARHSFVNFTYGQTLHDFERARRFLKRLRPELKFLITVSPVPLTATAEDAHVLCSTVHSKSILRAVAGSLARQYADVDYFPAYELVATPFVEASYDETKRTVTQEAVERVMNVFFRAHGEVQPLESALPVQGNSGGRTRPVPPRIGSATHDAVRDEVICEEVLLEAFAP